MEDEKRTFEAFLTPQQKEFINSMLPQGFSLQFSTKPSRRDSN